MRSALTKLRGALTSGNTSYLLSRINASSNLKQTDWFCCSEIEAKTRGALTSGSVDINELYEEKGDDVELTPEEDADALEPPAEAKEAVVQ